MTTIMVIDPFGCALRTTCEVRYTKGVPEGESAPRPYYRVTMPDGRVTSFNGGIMAGRAVAREYDGWRVDPGTLEG